MRQILFELDMFKHGNRAASEILLKKALDLLFTADVLYLRDFPNTPSIYSKSADVHYMREPLPSELYKVLPPDVRAFIDRNPHMRPLFLQTEIWKAIPMILTDAKRRIGSDCEDLACARAAELVVHNGIQARPGFNHRVIAKLSIYHIFVRLPDGQIEDPSKRLGMKAAA